MNMNNRIPNYIKSWLWVMFLCLGIFDAPLVFGSSLSADPIDSRVVDANTGEPIEGAVVLAYWELHQGSLTGHALPCAAANIEEAVTDKDGIFHLAGWGPVSATCGDMRNGNPMLYVFKPGYGYGMFANNQPGISIVAYVDVTHSIWDLDHPMKLTKFQDMDLKAANAKSYSANFGYLNGHLGIFITNMPDSCNWKKIPNMLRALELERLRISQAKKYQFGGVTATLIYQDAWFQKVAPQCGSPKEFIEGLIK
jgi:hypothetical protein